MSLLKIAERTTDFSERIIDLTECVSEAEVRPQDIGNILLDAGRLSRQDLYRIVALQAKENILFGEAAVELGILNDEDVRWALASQYSYPSSNTDDLRYSRDLLVLHEPFGTRVESFRSIRSALIFSGVGKLISSIGVVSPGEGEGKTFVAANLAVIFAQLGSRTLLVDLNFRSPRVHTLFQLKNNCGASSLIIKRAFAEDAIKKTSLSSLDILPSGPKPPNPLELLSWRETAQLFENMKDSYEVIVFDTPAFGKSTDGMVISGFCDATLLVALKGVTKNAAFGQVKKQLEGAGAKILGSVVNEIDERR